MRSIENEINSSPEIHTCRIPQQVNNLSHHTLHVHLITVNVLQFSSTIFSKVIIVLLTPVSPVHNHINNQRTSCSNMTTHDFVAALSCL